MAPLLKEVLHRTGGAWLITRQALSRRLREWHLRSQAIRLIDADSRLRTGRCVVVVVSTFGFGGVARVVTGLAGRLRTVGVASVAVATERGCGAEAPDYQRSFSKCIDLAGCSDGDALLVELVRHLGAECLFCAPDITGYRAIPALKRLRPQTRIVDFIPAVAAWVDEAPVVEIAPFVDVRLVESQHAWAEMRARYAGRRDEVQLAGRLAVTLNGVILPPMTNGAGRKRVRNRFGLHEEAFLVAYLGRFSSEKRVLNVLDIVEATRAVSGKVRYLLAGEGPLGPELIARIERRGMGELVQVIGFQKDPDHVLRACDVLILMSEHEGISNVALEALAHGKPVLSTRVGGMSEVVRDGVNGILVDDDGRAPVVMASALLRLMGDRGAYDNMSREARHTVEIAFNREQYESRLMQLVLGTGMDDAPRATTGAGTDPRNAA